MQLCEHGKRQFWEAKGKLEEEVVVVEEDGAEGMSTTHEPALRRSDFCHLLSLGSDLILKIWKSANGRILLGMQTCHHLREILPSCRQRIRLRVQQVSGSQANAEATMALLSRISNSLSSTPCITSERNEPTLELFLRDQLGPVLCELQFFQPAFSRVTHLNLRGRDVQSKGAGMLARMLRQCHGLEVLDLEMNDLGAGTMRELAPILPHLTCLRELCLGRTQLMDEGATYLAHHLPRCRSLAVLSLHSNDLGPDSATAISQSLVHSQLGLTDLNLGRNSIGPFGFAELSLALPWLTTLETLDVSSNHILGQGFADLAKAVQVGCPSLRRLLADNNSLRQGQRLRNSTLTGLCSGLCKNSPNFECISLTGNGFFRDSVLGDALLSSLPRQCTAELDDGCDPDCGSRMFVPVPCW